MRVAVLTLTRDRLAYTQHCFAKLREFAGCDFDHYVLDQGSTDGTPEWLAAQADIAALCLEENIGISRGMNLLLDAVVDVGGYDVIVKADNDLELTQPDTLRDVAHCAAFGGAILSPRILGLNKPPAPTGTFTISGETILDIPQIGGIFLAAPAWVYDEFRYGEDNPVWGGDDVEICHWFRGEGGRCGYLERLEAWHYETTNGQHARYPEYFAQKQTEGKVVL